MPKP
jgi:3-hydroxy-9,10-secoandrosta-1,3,5(10)-triene-9,17-dione monooxygenase reductase component